MRGVHCDRTLWKPQIFWRIRLFLSLVSHQDHGWPAAPPWGFKVSDRTEQQQGPGSRTSLTDVKLTMPKCEAPGLAAKRGLSDKAAKPRKEENPSPPSTQEAGVSMDNEWRGRAPWGVEAMGSIWGLQMDNWKEHVVITCAGVIGYRPLLGQTWRPLARSEGRVFSPLMSKGHRQDIRTCPVGRWVGDPIQS